MGRFRERYPRLARYYSNDFDATTATFRAGPRAELVTDDAGKLSDQLQKATGERVAALDGVALQAAHETVFGGKDAAVRDRGPKENATRDIERGLETARGSDRDGKPRDMRPSHVRIGWDSVGNAQANDRNPGSSPGLQRNAGIEKAMDPTAKPVELDLGM